MKPRTVPRDARVLRTYRELDSYLADFVRGIYPFLWMVGRPGIMKTESLKTVVRGLRVYYRKGGQLTPIQFFKDCYAHRAEPIILDDAEHLLDSKIGHKLISALGDSIDPKRLDYGSTTRALADVPQTFLTTSPLCIIANQGTIHEAIRSRAVTLYFTPTNLEVHQAVARWYWDQQVHDWFGEHLDRLLPIDARWYVTADQDKVAGRDWQQIILRAHSLDRLACIVQDLERSTEFVTREAKAMQFVSRVGTLRGASRATYFRIRKRLDDAGQLQPQIVSRIPLLRTTRTERPSLLELESDTITDLRQRNHPEEPAEALDLPAREQFTQPIGGASQNGRNPDLQQTPRMILDDRTAWEGPDPDDEQTEEPGD